MNKGVTSFYRRFDFFDSEEVATREDDDLKLDQFQPLRNKNSSEQKTDVNNNTQQSSSGINLFQDFEPHCAVSGAGLICFGDYRGYIKFLNRDLEIFGFQSHSERIQKLFKTPDKDILIACGNHVQIPNGPVESWIHIWRLSDIDELGHPKKIKAFRLFNEAIDEMPVCALTATRNGNQIAVGCANGVVLLYNLNLQNKNTYPKVKAIKLTKDGDHAVTGLHYLQSPQSPKTVLYIITVHAIMSCRVRSRNYPIVILDRTGGSDLNCSTINANNELIVAKSETVHIFKGEETRGEHAFPGDKKMVYSFNRYLIVVTAYLGVKHSNAHRVEVCIYDKANKYVAFRKLFDDLLSIVSEWGAIYMLTKERLIKLRDKDLQEKLNEFFRINLYEKAIQLAKSEGCPHSKIIEYYCKYGDFLYEKDDFDQAMEQYLQTIDKQSTIEPSYVIRKFLDAQKIKNLTEYLARLHEYGTPTKDHTTLLLNCYTKLKDSSKLNEFIKLDTEFEQGSSSTNSTNSTVAKTKHNSKYNFDVSTAINVCREAGLLEHARSLAKQDKQHQIYLDILLEEASMGNKNIRKYQSALKYISQLPFLEAEKSIKRIGKTLIEKEAQGTTELIKLLCIEWPNDDERADSIVSQSHKNVVGTASNTLNSNEMSIHDSVSSIHNSLSVNRQMVYNSGVTKTKRLFSNPEEFIHLFVRQPAELKNFLEYLVETEPSRCSTVVYNTLLEIYMREAFESKLKAQAIQKQTGSESSAQEFRLEYERAEKCIMRVLRTESKYDATHALALGKMYAIESAVIYLYETLHLYHEIISHYRDKNDGKGIIDACTNFCEREPSLWISAFTYFIQEEHVNEEDEIGVGQEESMNQNESDQQAQEEKDQQEQQTAQSDRIANIQLCLKNISKRNLLPPLMVIELLSNTDVELGVIKDYIVQDLVAQQTQIEEDEQCINELQQQITEMKNTIADLTHKPKTFQATKCSVCKAPLNLPTIHFMCGHSVHEKCLYHKTNVRCPSCQMTHDQIYNKQEMMQRSKGDHKIFFGKLSSARQTGNAFKTVAEYFGRGVIY